MSAGERRSPAGDDVALAVDGLPRFTRVEWGLLALVAALCWGALIAEAFGAEQPDPVDLLPVWSVQVCPRDGGRGSCWRHGDPMHLPSVTREQCQPIARAVRAQDRRVRTWCGVIEGEPALDAAESRQ